MVKWTEPAEKHLKAIHDYIACDSSYYAKEVVDKIMEKTLLLEQFPSLGRMVPELRTKKIREIFAYSYRIIYEVTAKDVLILAVIHSRRDFSKVW